MPVKLPLQGIASSVCSKRRCTTCKPPLVPRLCIYTAFNPYNLHHPTDQQFQRSGHDLRVLPLRNVQCALFTGCPARHSLSIRRNTRPYKHVNSLTPPTLMPATPRYRTLQPHAAPSLDGNLVASSPESGISLPCITASAARNGSSAGNSTRPDSLSALFHSTAPSSALLPLTPSAPRPPSNLLCLPLSDSLQLVLLLSRLCLATQAISGNMLTVHPSIFIAATPLATIRLTSGTHLRANPPGSHLFTPKHYLFNY